jgi:hypothetical protein
MTDDLLLTFRSKVPLPDEATARRIYARSVSGRPHTVKPRRLVVAVALLAIAGLAGGLTATLDGGGSKPPTVTGPSGPVTGGLGPYANNLFTFNRDGQLLTSVGVTVRSQYYPDATVAIEVLHRDASQPANIDVAKTETVFVETAPMTATGATGEGAVLSTWSGTLSPSDWNGGCQDGYYVIETAIYPAGTTHATPFDPKYQNEESNEWFSCNGS